MAWSKIIYLFVILAVFFSGVNSAVGHEIKVAAAGDAQAINELTKKITDKHKEIDELKRQSDLYKKNIEVKQNEVISLLNQIAILENQIAKSNIDIKTQEAQIEQTNLEIVDVQLQIQDKEKKILQQKDKISALIRTIHQEDRKSYLEIMLVNNSFAEFFDQLQRLEQVEGDLGRALDQVIALKAKLEDYNKDLENKSKALVQLKTRLEEFRSKLEGEKSAKEILALQTQNSEQRFQNLLAQTKLEKRALDLEILDLENAIRTKVEQNKQKFADLDTPSQLIWPVAFNGITTYFNDPDYVFRRWVGEHSGLDLRTLIDDQPANGVPVRSAASGTVIKTINNGKFTGNAVYLAHGGGLMTVYLHLSRVDVNEDEFIPVGKIIGISGGLPGTFGAGLSTGPHLHFEVRFNGIPVNPLEYLPPPPIFVSNSKTGP